MKQLFQSFISLILFCTLSHSVNAGGLPDGTQALTEKLAVLETFQGSFVQQVTEVNGRLIQQATGNLYASNAGDNQGLLYWHTRAPMEQLVVGDGQRVWLYDPDLLQVVVQQYPQDLSSTPALLLIGEVSHLADQYQVARNPDPDRPEEYILTPRNTENVYTSITLRFEGNLPIAMILQDSLQQSTSITFTDVRINQSLDQSLFHFQVPEGVDLIRND